jgi:hypothetical protein
MTTKNTKKTSKDSIQSIKERSMISS